MQDLHKNLEKILLSNERLVSEDGKILKNKITELAISGDKELLSSLLKDNKIKGHFFTEIDKGVLSFEREKFINFINTKEFLPNSFTSFKNKIGLIVGDEYMKSSKKVALAWAYKDCVLEGGQDKENQKRSEVFYNEVLAPDEIDRLLDKKVFTNVKKIDKNGEKKVETFDNDNLIIKGNNLLVLTSLLEKYREKIKLIYVDVPYNTGSDSFGYNDRFNHSTWLTFMKNRLEVARELLRNDGSLFIQVDHHELGYINVLLDEIFGIQNKVQVISVKTSAPSGFKAVNPGPIDVTEYILFYTKNKSSFNFKKAYVPVKYNSNYNLFIEDFDKDVSQWKFIPIKEKVLLSSGFKKESELKKKFGDSYKILLKEMISEYAFNNADRVVSVRDLHKPTETVRDLQIKSKTNNKKIITHKKQDGTFMYLYNGGALAFYSSKINEIDGKKTVTELLSDFWNHISWAGIAKEGGITLKNGKKPEKLLKQIIDISTESGDIVLDYHLGSGTTCAVAHKMNRKYIGIEQLDYGKNDSAERLKNVINGDLSGISKSINWEGGGSFVYAELKELNQEFINDIEKVDSKSKLKNIYKKMQKEAFFRYEVDLSKFDEKDFDKLELEEQKQILIECLDKNHLYVNYSEIEDSTYKISPEDKKINKLFYEKN